LTQKLIIYGDSEKYKLLSQKENDKFRMEEGYEIKYIKELVEQHQQSIMRYINMHKESAAS